MRMRMSVQKININTRVLLPLLSAAVVAVAFVASPRCLVVVSGFVVVPVPTTTTTTAPALSSPSSSVVFFGVGSTTVPSTSTATAAAAATTSTTSTSASTRLHASSSESSSSSTTSSSTKKYYLGDGDPVLLVGPGLLQLVLARHLYHEGLRPIIVASQSQLDSFFQNLLKEDNLDEEEYTQLLEDSTIGMPEMDDPYFGDLKGVVFCAEDAVLPPEFVSRVLDFTDQDESAFAEDEPVRVVCCLPTSQKIQKEKSNSWIPIFNNDKKQQETWQKFETSYKNHKCFASTNKGGCGSIVRFGSLFGGSTDGPPSLELFGLDEGMYKMSLEQYRDMRERAFDRYKLAAQILDGDQINPKPNDQDSREKEELAKYPGPTREAFTILAEYPEQDRSNRHVVAAAVTKMLQMPVEGSSVEGESESEGATIPRELTVLSKARSELPTDDEWNSDLLKPPFVKAEWPDPAKWKPSDYGLLEE